MSLYSAMLDWSWDIIVSQYPCFDLILGSLALDLSLFQRNQKSFRSWASSMLFRFPAYTFIRNTQTSDMLRLWAFSFATFGHGVWGGVCEEDTSCASNCFLTMHIWISSLARYPKAAGLWSLRWSSLCQEGLANDWSRSTGTLGDPSRIGVHI